MRPDTLDRDAVRVPRRVRRRRTKKPAPLVTVDVAPRASIEIERTIRTDGLLYPLQQAAIVPKFSAPIRKVDVPAQARASVPVQLLIELENRDLAGAASEANAASQLAEATFETTAKATVRAGTAESRARRAVREGVARRRANAVRQPAGSLQAGRGRSKDVNDAQVALSQARIAVTRRRRSTSTISRGSRASPAAQGAPAPSATAARARNETAQAQLGYSRITSPIDGVVTDLPFYPGEIVAERRADRHA